MPRNPLGEVAKEPVGGAAIFTRPVSLPEKRVVPVPLDEDPAPSAKPQPRGVDSTRAPIGRPKSDMPKRGVTVRLTNEGQKRLLMLEVELLDRGIRGSAASVTEIVEALLLNADIDDLADILAKKQLKKKR